MPRLKWSTSHAVFVAEIDDAHQEIFAALSDLEGALASHKPGAEIHGLAQALNAQMHGHFDHEERLMRAARYSSLRWHKQQHDSARKRVGQFVRRMEPGDAGAGLELAEYLTSWLDNHTRIADKMLGAFLRNQERGLWKLTFRAGTTAADKGGWLRADGTRFDPQA